MAKNKFIPLSEDDGLPGEPVQVVETTKEKPEVISFEKAFRMFRRDNPQTATWTQEAVEKFARKKLPLEANSYEDWAKVFAQY